MLIFLVSIITQFLENLYFVSSEFYVAETLRYAWLFSFFKLSGKLRDHLEAYYCLIFFFTCLAILKVVHLENHYRQINKWHVFLINKVNNKYTEKKLKIRSCRLQMYYKKTIPKNSTDVVAKHRSQAPFNFSGQLYHRIS